MATHSLTMPLQPATQRSKLRRLRDRETPSHGQTLQPGQPRELPRTHRDTGLTHRTGNRNRPPTEKAQQPTQGEQPPAKPGTKLRGTTESAPHPERLNRTLAIPTHQPPLKPQPPNLPTDYEVKPPQASGPADL